MFEKYLNDINVFVSFYFENVILLNFSLYKNKKIIIISIYNLSIHISNKNIDMLDFEYKIKEEFNFIKEVSVTNDRIFIYEKSLSDIRLDKLNEIDEYFDYDDIQ